MMTSVAETILRQLGGISVLRRMVGASQFDNTPNGCGVTFRIPSNLSRPRINTVLIRLNGKDLYDIEFRDVRHGPVRSQDQLVSTVSDVFAEDLIATFERSTGLVLQPPRMITRQEARSDDEFVSNILGKS